MSKKEPTAQKRQRNETEGDSQNSYEQWLTQIDGSWLSALNEFISANRLEQIHSWVAQEYAQGPCRPPYNEIFTAFRLTPFDQVKVVIVGQDPYPGPNDAMGLSFSVHRGVNVPGSLRNIYKCLETDPQIQFTRPKHGDLSYWAQQGVFMLNAVLTVRQGKANSHAKHANGWEAFTTEVIKVINEQLDHVVFMLWGNFAQQKAAGVNRQRHRILEGCHPSPLSASKGGFFTCGHFSQANEYLESVGKSPIDWQLD